MANREAADEGWSYVHHGKGTGGTRGFGKVDMAGKGRGGWKGYGKGAEEASSPCKLFVANIEASVTERDLSLYFQRYGRTNACVLIHDRDTGRSKCFAFVEM